MSRVSAIDLAALLRKRRATVAKHGGRMENGDHDCAVAKRLGLTTQFRDPGLRVEQQLRREVPERDHDVRLDESDLGCEIRPTGFDLDGMRIPIPRWPTLHDVRDVDVGARQTDVSMREVSSFPARPTNGSPVRSSSALGPSPTNIRLACSSPVPNTTCVRPAARGHRVHARASSRSAANEANPGTDGW